MPRDKPLAGIGKVTYEYWRSGRITTHFQPHEITAALRKQFDRCKRNPGSQPEQK